jgi:dGTPase
MEKRMQWQKLLATKRVADFTQCDTQPKLSQLPEVRSAFEKDFDQITFSYPFRRLQDKTQVIPFPKFDFVHTRLTHSLEVASIGRSFGKMAADLIFQELDPKEIDKLGICKSDIGALVASACLAHDIGNPPFGHSGEDSISYYFTQTDQIFRPDFILTEGKCIRNYVEWDDDQNPVHKTREIPLIDGSVILKRWGDLSSFEGNANGFRIITQNCDKGINPTYALLGTFSKYPRESVLISNPFEHLDKSDRPKSQSKYGFFQEQKNLFKDVAQELGLLRVEGVHSLDIAFHRHPLAFLMEASDDIAYGIVDFEDGCRLGLIDFDKSYGSLVIRQKDNSFKTTVFNRTPKEILISIAKKDESFDIEKLNSFKDFKQAVAYLRSKVVNVLIHECFKVFKENYESIMTGNFDKAIIDCIQDDEIIDSLKHMKALVRKFVYSHRPVLESEASGFEVMEHLINAFAITSNICYSCGDTETAKDIKLRSLLPDEFQPSVEKEIENLTDEEKYERVLRVLDYISGMTDKYAINLYRKIKGISLE